jgi:hypothetical protein
MQKIIDTQQTDDPNTFGEVLRELCFAKEYGCYSCFDLVEGFRKVEDGSNIQSKLWMALECHPLQQQDAEDREDEQSYKDWVTYLFEDTRDRAKLFTNGSVHIGWHWDGDGTLVFIEGDKCAVNTDCKKSNRWEWQ